MTRITAWSLTFCHQVSSNSSQWLKTSLLQAPHQLNPLVSSISYDELLQTNRHYWLLWYFPCNSFNYLWIWNLCGESSIKIWMLDVCAISENKHSIIFQQNFIFQRFFVGLYFWTIQKAYLSSTFAHRPYQELNKIVASKHRLTFPVILMFYVFTCSGNT